MCIRRASAWTPIRGTNPMTKDATASRLSLARACGGGGSAVRRLPRPAEINVAFGGTLHPEISELPGRMNHRAPRVEKWRDAPGSRRHLRRPARRASDRGACWRDCSAPKPSGSIRCTARAYSSRAIVSSWRARRGWNHRGDQRCRREGFRARRTMARRIRPAAQSGEPRPSRGLRAGGELPAQVRPRDEAAGPPAKRRIALSFPPSPPHGLRSAPHRKTP